MERDTQHVINWQNSLKVAISLENLDEVYRLIQALPKTDDFDMLESNLALAKEAIDLFQTKQDKLVVSMENIKKSRKFLEFLLNGFIKSYKFCLIFY